MLNLTHETKKHIDIIKLEGILNADTSPELETILESISKKECPCILMQMPELTYISSAGIGCFIGVIKEIRTKGGDIRFANTNPEVRRVFNLLDMNDFFHFFDDRQTGIASFDNI